MNRRTFFGVMGAGTLVLESCSQVDYVALLGEILQAAQIAVPILEASGAIPGGGIAHPRHLTVGVEDGMGILNMITNGVAFCAVEWASSDSVLLKIHKTVDTFRAPALATVAGLPLNGEQKQRLAATIQRVVALLDFIDPTWRSGVSVRVVTPTAEKKLAKIDRARLADIQAQAEVLKERTKPAQLSALPRLDLYGHQAQRLDV
jgi:hypothetical protein